MVNNERLFFTGLKTSNVEDADEVDLLHCWVLQESDETVQDEDITHNEGSIAEINLEKKRVWNGFAKICPN